MPILIIFTYSGLVFRFPSFDLPLLRFRVQGDSVSNAQISLTLSLGIQISRPIVSIPPNSINHPITAAKIATELSHYLGRPITRGGGEVHGVRLQPPTGPKVPHFDTQYPS